MIEYQLFLLSRHIVVVVETPCWTVSLSKICKLGWRLRSFLAPRHEIVLKNVVVFEEDFHDNNKLVG